MNIFQVQRSCQSVCHWTYFFNHFIVANKSKAQLALFLKSHHLLPRRYFQKHFFCRSHIEYLFFSYQHMIYVYQWQPSIFLQSFSLFLQSLISSRGQSLSFHSIPSNTMVFYIFFHINPRKVSFQYLIGNCCCTQIQLKECVYPNYPHSRSHNSLTYLLESKSLFLIVTELQSSA